jgi:RHS repeat-associated protein
LGQSLDNTVLNNNSRLQGTISDSQIVTASYSFAGGQTVVLPINSSGNFYAPFDFTGITDGSHQLTLTFTDAAGNSVDRIYAINLTRGPLLTVALLNDTGASNSDGITTDVTIRGQVADRTQISRLEIALDGTTNYADYSFALQNDGSFQLSALQVNSLAGGQLATGAHVLNVRTVSANGIAVATSQLSFTLQAIDTTNSIQLALAISNDSGPIGDGVTDAATVSLIAKAASGSTLTLVGLNKTGVADATGQVVFENISLALGANNFTVTKDGLQQQFSFQRVAPNNVVLEWNAIALGVLQRDPYTPPPMFSRNLAMVQAAVYDAVNAVSQRYSVYKVDINAAVGTSEEAAAASAAARILSKLYPSQQALLNAALTRTLSTITDGAGKTAGIELGNNVADQIFAWRSTDGAKTQVPYQNSTEIGKWQPSLPNFGGALYPQWPLLKPYALDTGSQFRPNGLPSLNSAEYTAAYNEVSQLGARNSTVRTADQTQIAQFWSDGSGTYTPVGHWNQIAGTVASVKGTSIIETARLFAQLDVALADAGIAAWDSKYTYNSWRPITAIRDAGLDGNANTTADPNWQPLIDTPPFPEYVSGHSTFSAAAAAVLGKTFGDSFQFQSGSVTLPGTSRSFTSFTGAAAEAGQSRIYGGIHFQFSNRDGLTLGKSIGDYVADRFLIDETKGAIGVKLSLDTAAFGSTNRDRVTKVADLTGVVRLDQPGLRLQIAQVGGAFTDVAVNVDKTFNLSASQLAAAIGTLTDKTYQLTLRLVDGSDAVVGSNNFSFTLDTTAPVIQIGDLTGASPLAHLVGATDIGGAGRFKVDGGAWNSFALQADGKFDTVINAAGLAAGLHQVEVQIADAADNLAGQIVNVSIDGNGGFYSSPATNAGWGQVLTNGFALYEGNSLITEKSIDVTFGGAGQRVLEFDLQTSFDGSDTRSFAHDRVAFYLVDANGVALSINGNRPGGLPVFAYGESGTDTIPGLVQFDGSHVKIDVSGVNAAAGKLVVQLLNQDGDGRGNIQVTNFVDRVDAQAVPGKAVSPYVAPATPGAAVVLDGYLGTTNGQLLLSDVSFDKATGKYSADLRVKNVGSTVLSRNLAVLLSELPAGVTVGNASGIHAAGSAYLNFATAIQAGGLAGGAISGAIRVEINDPNLKAFGFKPVVLQGAAEPIPDLSTLRNLTVKVGDKLDFALDPNLALSIASSVNLPTGSITGDSHLVFTPAPSQIGTYEFTLIARNGSTETRQAVTLNVVADPITTTRVTGIVANTNQAGIAGVLVELAGQQATTDAAGKFEIVVPDGAAGDTLKIYGQRIQGGSVTYPFIAEKMNLLLGHDVYQGVNNGIDRPIYLPTIDLSTGTTIDPNSQTIATNPNLSGAQVTVNANSLYDKNGNAFAGVLSITEVPTNLTPAALPPNLHPDLVVTIQPGDMVFNTPARLILPNRAGYKPGVLMDLWSINPNTGLFDIVGKGQVSADGSVIKTIEGGIRNSSWHFFVTPPDLILNFEENHNKNKSCEDTKSFKSEASSLTGAVSDDRALVSYSSQGIDRSVTLHYDSLRANPTQIFRISGTVETSLFNVDYITAKVTILANGISQTISGLNSAQASGINGGERIWSVSGKYVNTAIYGDLSNLESGVYDSLLEVGVRGLRTGGLVGNTEVQADKVVVVNDSNSVFGSGWNISGLQKLVVNQDNSALLIDGNGSQWLFEAPIGNIFKSPLGDFSRLEKLGNGTFQRITKDGTRYQFNTQGLMVAVTDTEGNATNYIYNSTDQIQQIVDPVGLITTFKYSGNRVTSVVDPAGRSTVFSYDAQGDLLSVTDPDGTQNRYGYDGKHLLSSSIDKVGQIRTGTYDEFGRAKTATREDGSTVTIVPVEVQGLLNELQTTNLNNIPKAGLLPFNPVSSYTDGNGQVLKTVLNQRGKVISQADKVGFLASNTYDSSYLVSSQTNSNKQVTEYQYDDHGNVTKVVRSDDSFLRSDSSIDTFNSSLHILNKTVLSDTNNVVNVSGDINNDGFTDIVTSNGYDILVSYGDRLGSFSQSYQIPRTAYSNFDQAIGTNILYEQIQQIELKDINNDGLLDLIVDFRAIVGGDIFFANATNAILVLINRENGQFQDGQFLNAKILNLTSRSRGFTVGDFNHDGKLDILSLDPSDTSWFSTKKDNILTLFAGDGQGNFNQVAINIPEVNNASWGYNVSIQSLDIDGDGKKELVFNSYDKLLAFKYSFDLSAWVNIGNYISDFYNSRNSKTIAGDLNNDGFGDLVTFGTTQANIFLGQSNGSFLSQTLVFDNDFQTYDPNNRLVESIKIADINNDGKVDLIIAGEKIVITDPPYKRRQLISKFYTIDNSNQFQLSGTTPSIGLPSTSVYVAFLGKYIEFDDKHKFVDLIDVNGDGDLDFVWQNADSTTNNFAIVDNQRIVRQTSTVSKQYTYDSVFNQLTSVTDELGRKTIYDLDVNTGKLLKSTRVVGQLDVNTTAIDDVITSYTYTLTGQIDVMTDALGHITDYDYDSRGNLVKATTAKGTVDESIEQYEYDLAGNKTATIDALGHRTTYVYNSTNMLLQSIDALGGTTTYNYDRMGHQISMTDALGRITRMTYDVRGRLASTIDANGGVTTNSYDNNGNLVSVRDPLGRVTKYQYDERNRLIRSIDASGGATATKYDLNNNVVASTDKLGHTTQRFYDSRDRLIREVDALGNETKYRYDAANQMIASIDANGHITTYQYDELGRRVAVVDALGHTIRTEYDKLGDVVATVDANGNRTEYKYDALDRQIEVKDAWGGLTKTVYDKVGNTISITDALNHSTIFEYDALDRNVSITDALGHSTTSAFDAVGNLLSLTNTLGNKTTYAYDNLNQQVSTTDALNQTRSITYDAVDNVVKTTDELGRATAYTYDALNRRTQVTDALGQVQTVVYDSEGNVRSSTDALGHTTAYTYDALDRQVKMTDALGGITSTSYDALGNVVAVTDALNHSTAFGYDALDRRISVTNALGQATTSAFDAVGNLLSVKDALGRTTAYAYDSLNRRVAATDALGQTRSITYDAVDNAVKITDELGQMTSFGYDALDRRTGVTDALGQTQTTVYDAEGNVRSATDGIGNTTRYDYDVLNRQVKVTDAKGGITSTNYDAVGNVAKITDSVGNSTTYLYDAIDRLLKETNQLGFSRSHAYDAVGNQIEMIDRNNRKTTYGYDSLNRRTGENWIGVGGVNLRSIGYTYNAVGNVITATDPDAKYTYGYDALNRLTSLDNTGTAGVPAVVFNYLYDAVGRLVTVGDRISGSNAGQTDYTFDQLNRVTKITQAGAGVQSKRVDMTYNQINQMTGLTRFSDLGGVNLVAETSYTYDQSQRLIQLAHKKGASNLANYNYTFDAANKLTKIISSADGTVNYAYDATNQLTGADHSNQTDEAYQYDANGNRTNAGNQTGTNNQLLSDGQFTYQYDQKGNRTKRTEIATGKVTEYVWDYRNRLAQVLFKDGAGIVTKSIEYTYDVNNQRIGKKIDGVVTERYVIDRNQIALVFDGAGVQKSRYFYGAQVDQVLAEESGTQVRWFLTDYQGTVKDVIDNTGIVIDHITYDSFGQIVGQTSSINLRFAYTGREFDGETGQYYYRARYYDAADGRFISEDPISFNAGDTNLSRYVSNKPINFTDPSGLEVLAPIAPVTPTLPVTPTSNIPNFKLPSIPAIPNPLFLAPLLWGTIFARPTATENLADIKRNPDTTTADPDTTLKEKPRRNPQNEGERKPFDPSPPPEAPKPDEKCSKTCDSDEFKKYAKYSNISIPNKSNRSGYIYVLDMNNITTTGLNAALNYIQGVRDRKKAETREDRKDKQNSQAWWSADIKIPDGGQVSRTTVCPYPEGFSRHYNVLLENESLRIKYGWNSSSVGSIGQCVACKEDPLNGPQIVTVFAALNVKNVGGNNPLPRGF